MVNARRASCGGTPRSTFNSFPCMHGFEPKSIVPPYSFLRAEVAVISATVTVIIICIVECPELETIRVSDRHKQ